MIEFRKNGYIRCYMTLKTVNIADKLGLIVEQWTPKLVGMVDEYAIKLAKVEGEFVWHQHEDADELFLVIKGALTIRLRDGEVNLREGELVVIPRGVEHMPVADQECHLLLFERATVRNTGNVTNERTLETIEKI